MSPRSLKRQGPRVATKPGRATGRLENQKRQAIIDSWPADVDDSAARADWDFAPEYDFERAFREYLIPSIGNYYRS